MTTTASPSVIARVTMRPFDKSAADYTQYVEISNANYPEHPYSVEEIQHDDASWNAERYEKLRLIAEDPDGRVVGYGEISHIANQFHPQKYWLEVYVHPPVQRRGYGSAIYQHMLGELRRRHAIAVRSATKDTMAHVLSFLEQRGFLEVQRQWESRLDVSTIDLDAFASAEPRALAQGITFTTLADELARDRQAALRQVYDLYVAVNRDVPSVDTYTPPSFDDWIKRSIENPDLLPEGYLLAQDGDRLVAQSALWRNSSFPDVLQQGVTGVLREYRGKGVAVALKILGVKFALANGYREIRTNNDTRNRPMLRINETMGFVKQPAWVIFEKNLV